MAKLVYLISAAHSGSTLLDIITGTIPGVFSTGECVYLPWQLYRNGDMCELHQDICSCGSKFSECHAWKKIIAKLNQKVDFNIWENPFKFRIAMLKGQRYQEALTWYERILKKIYSETMQIKHLSLFPKACQLPVQKIIKNNWLLYDTIGKTFNIDYVVDSSKEIERMRLLHSFRPNDVHVIILVRDILGVAASSSKRGGDPVASALKWVEFYRKAERAVKFCKNIKVQVVRYEDLVKHPATTRSLIARYLELQDPGTTMAINTHEHHLVAGNPMRYRGRIDIEYDESWRTILPQSLQNKILDIKNQTQTIFHNLEELSS